MGTFNPQYNALIGGRGTGKSTILEYVRWALCDQLPDLAGGEDMPNYQVRRRNLIAQTLQELKATVQVTFLVNGIPHVVRRFSEPQEIHLKIGDAEFGPCHRAIRASAFPAAPLDWIRAIGRTLRPARNSSIRPRAYR